jgi:hypothetical protein
MKFKFMKRASFSNITLAEFSIMDIWLEPIKRNCVKTGKNAKSQKAKLKFH